MNEDTIRKEVAKRSSDIKSEVTEELRKEFASNRYTDTERLAAFEILLTEIQQMLMKFDLSSGLAETIIDMIDEEMDK